MCRALAAVKGEIGGEAFCSLTGPAAPGVLGTDLFWAVWDEDRATALAVADALLVTEALEAYHAASREWEGCGGQDSKMAT